MNDKASIMRLFFITISHLIAHWIRLYNFRSCGIKLPPINHSLLSRGMKMTFNQWPPDVDGDVFRGLEKNKFDFSKQCIVDFNIDFEPWPPPKEALNAITRYFGIYRTIEDGQFIMCSIAILLTYDYVMKTQREVTLLVSPWGGYCDSWGVMNMNGHE